MLAIAFLVLLIGGGARFAIGLTFKPMVDEFGWSRGELGLAVGLYMVVSAFATFFAGRMADRFSPRALLTGGTVFGGIGIALMSLVSQPWHALVLYGVVFAIGNGAASLVIVGVIVMRVYPGRAGLANAVAISGMSVGQLVMIALLAAGAGADRLALRCSCGSASRISCCCRCCSRCRERARRRRAARKASCRCARPRARASSGCCSRSMRSAGSTISSSPRTSRRSHRIAASTPLFAGNLLALMGLTGLAGVIVSGLASDRFGPVWPTAAAFAARIVVFAWIAVDQSPFSIAVFALVFGATFLVTAPLTVVFVRESFGTQQSRRARRADHHDAPDLRRARRLCGRRDLRRDRRL